jgi:hypothetical protein
MPITGYQALVPVWSARNPGADPFGMFTDFCTDLLPTREEVWVTKPGETSCVRCGDLWILRFIILEDPAEHAAAVSCRWIWKALNVRTPPFSWRRDPSFGLMKRRHRHQTYEWAFQSRERISGVLRKRIWYSMGETRVRLPLREGW